MEAWAPLFALCLVSLAPAVIALMAKRLKLTLVLGVVGLAISVGPWVVVAIA
jgi:hypothetical protein